MRQRGFTLLELIVCVAIVAILAAIALPNFAVVVANTRVRSTADEIRDTLTRARQESLKRNVPVTVAVTNNVVTLTVPKFGAKPAIEITKFPVKANVFGGPATLEGSGRASANATFAIASPTHACKANGGAIMCYQVQIFLGGAVRMCDPTATAGGPKACL